MIPYSDAFNSVLTPSTVNTAVAPQYGKNPDGSISGGLLNGITQLANAFGAAAPAIAAIKGNQPTTQVAGQVVPLSQQPQNSFLAGIDQKTMIMLGVGGLAVVGLILFAATRK